MAHARPTRLDRPVDIGRDHVLGLFRRQLVLAIAFKPCRASVIHMPRCAQSSRFNVLAKYASARMTHAVKISDGRSTN
jgi:hypothetical protein